MPDFSLIFGDYLAPPPPLRQPPDYGTPAAAATAAVRTAVRTVVEWYVEVKINLGVPAPPLPPPVYWQSEPMAYRATAQTLATQLQRLVYAIDAAFRTRQAQLGQPYVDMPGIHFGVLYRHVVVAAVAAAVDDARTPPPITPPPAMQ